MKSRIYHSLRKLRGIKESNDNHGDHIRSRHHPSFIREFMFGREGYSIHSLSTCIINNEIFFIVGSRSGGIKVFNALGQPVVENNCVTASTVVVVYSKLSTHIISCGKDTVIPVWKVGPNGTCSFMRSLMKHHDTVKSLDSIYIAKYRNLEIISGSCYLASGGNDHAVIIWSMDDEDIEQINTFHGHSSKINDVKFLIIEETAMVVSGDDSGLLIVWNIFTLQIHSRYTLRMSVRSLVTSNGSKGETPVIACIDCYGQLHVWDLSKKSMKFPIISREYNQQVRAITIQDQTDERLLIGGCDDGSLWFWSLSSGSYLYHFSGHTSWITTLHITEGNSPVLVSGGCDSKVKCWNLSSIMADMKYSRRKNFLMFLVGYQLLPPSNQSIKFQDSVSVASSTHYQGFTGDVFSKKDLCFQIAKFL